MKAGVFCSMKTHRSAISCRHFGGTNCQSKQPCIPQVSNFQKLITSFHILFISLFTNHPVTQCYTIWIIKNIVKGMISVSINKRVCTNFNFITYCHYVEVNNSGCALFRHVCIKKCLLPSSRLSVCPSAWISAAVTGRISVKFDVRNFYKNLSFYMF
jgi:hypothetical protein